MSSKMDGRTINRLVKPGWPTSWPIAAIYNTKSSLKPRHETKLPLLNRFCGFQRWEENRIVGGGTILADLR